MFAVEDATNFVVPLVTCEEDLFCMVEVTVSRVLAVRYVPPYSMQMRANGLEKTREWGRRMKEVIEDLREFLRVFWPDAFCIMPLQDISWILGRGEHVLVNDCNNWCYHTSCGESSSSISCQPESQVLGIPYSRFCQWLCEGWSSSNRL